jgi:hypothetical protein
MAGEVVDAQVNGHARPRYLQDVERDPLQQRGEDVAPAIAGVDEQMRLRDVHLLFGHDLPSG